MTMRAAQTKTVRAGLVGGLVAAVITAGLGTANAEPPEGWDIAHAEVPAAKVTLGSADTAVMPDGNVRTFAVSNGRPDSQLVEIDPLSGEVIRSLRMADAEGSWGLRITDEGDVWASSQIQGEMWELPWGAEEPIAHDRPTPDSSFVWQVDADEAGAVYGGTYQGWAEDQTPKPPAVLFRIGPDGEQTVYDAFGAEHEYVRSTAVVGDTVYAGTGSIDGKLFAVDPTTGDREEIPLPEDLGTCTFVYEMTRIGEQLAVRLQECDNGTSSNIGVIYDPTTGDWSDWRIDEFSGAISQPSDDGVVYAAADGVIAAFDLNGGTGQEPTGTPLSSEVSPSTKDVELVTDPATGDDVVVSVSATGKIIRHDLTRGSVDSGIPEGLAGDTGATARTAVTDADGNYHVSLRRTGGLGSFTLAEGAWTYEGGIGQGQGMTVHDGIVYIGLYPSARISAYDPTENWEQGNPREVASLDDDGQDRPFALVSAGDQLAIGTVAEYGSLNGSLALYDPVTDELTVHTEEFSDRSIIALVHHDGVLYGGTTIYGGNGSTPTRAEGTVFAWNIETEQILWERPVLPGEKGIGAVTVDEHGRLFAASVGKVAEIDPESGETVQSADITDDESGSLQGAWHISDLSWNSVENALYLSTRTQVVRIDPRTLEDITPVPTEGELLRVAPDGTNFWMNGRTVHSGSLPPLPEEPDQQPEEPTEEPTSPGGRTEEPTSPAPPDAPSAGSGSEGDTSSGPSTAPGDDRGSRTAEQAGDDRAALARTGSEVTGAAAAAFLALLAGGALLMVRSSLSSRSRHRP
ncbi:hypothetical protein ACT3SQ_04325 [Brachybacterium sp. AOP42-C2-15]|uniref:hypothetical protein n=1 Tax=unclassified Brachybacterium TaxID=2623841 RepID=UPI004033DD85